VSAEKSIHDKLEQEHIAWDYYGPAWMGILKQIRREKDQQRHELLMTDRRKQKLEEWRKRLEQREFNLKDRETRVFEAEPFLSVAKQLQNLGIKSITFDDSYLFIEWKHVRFRGAFV